MPGAEDIRELQNVLLNAQDIYQVTWAVLHHTSTRKDCSARRLLHVRAPPAKYIAAPECITSHCL
jgi:hypothetical protein